MTGKRKKTSVATLLKLKPGKATRKRWEAAGYEAWPLVRPKALLERVLTQGVITYSGGSKRVLVEVDDDGHAWTVFVGKHFRGPLGGGRPVTQWWSKNVRFVQRSLSFEPSRYGPGMDCPTFLRWLSNPPRRRWTTEVQLYTRRPEWPDDLPPYVDV